MAEKKWIVKTKRKSPLINADSEIYGPCRHLSKPPRFLATCSCTDEHGECEKGKCPIAIKIHKEAVKKAKREAREKAKLVKKTSKAKKAKPVKPRKPLTTVHMNGPVLCRLIR